MVGVLFLDPTLVEGKGLVYMYIEQLFGVVFEFCHSNQILTLWFTCDCYVALHYSKLLLHMHVRVV